MRRPPCPMCVKFAAPIPTLRHRILTPSVTVVHMHSATGAFRTTCANAPGLLATPVAGEAASAPTPEHLEVLRNQGVPDMTRTRRCGDHRQHRPRDDRRV